MSMRSELKELWDTLLFALCLNKREPRKHYTHLFTLHDAAAIKQWPPLARPVPPTPAAPTKERCDELRRENAAFRAANPDVFAERKTCGFVPPTPGYAPCTRDAHAPWEPCAHPLSTEAIRWDVGLTHDGFPEIDALAQRLHREYRAASKALKGTAKHDHGWKHCRKKRYFWNRARQWRKWRKVKAVVTKA